MKLQCEVDVINRILAAHNMNPRTKYLKSTLALGKEPKDDTEFFILYFSSQHKNGVKYKLKKNITQVFVKYLNEGKCTIRFVQPPHDMCIKGEIIQLKGFLRSLKLCLSGDIKDMKSLNLSSVSVTASIPIPTKLCIKDRSEYPDKGLPRTLERLSIIGLKLSNFRREILLLRHLRYLDLSGNEIEKLPPEIGRMPHLTELIMSNNLLGRSKVDDWKWITGPQITKSLKLLDLSKNNLSFVPQFFWKLSELITLNLNENNLPELPNSIGRIKTLKYLDISKNLLVTLPCSLRQCRLEDFDMSSNNFHQYRMEHSITKNFEMGTLVTLSGTAVLKYNIFYANNVIPYTLVDFLDSSGSCICGAPTANKTSSLKKTFSVKDFSRTVVNNLPGQIFFDCFFCSRRCISNLK